MSAVWHASYNATSFSGMARSAHRSPARLPGSSADARARRRRSTHRITLLKYASHCL